MAASEHTPHYNLSQFGPGDRPSWLGDYNQDMRIIDTRITTADQTANNALAKSTANESEIAAHDARIATADKTANDALTLAQTNERNIATNDTDITRLKQANYTNVALYDIDNTGATDCSEKLQTIIDSAATGIYFPAGIYRIDRTLRFPYNTANSFGVQLDAGATIIAGAQMDVMLQFGAYDKNHANKKCEGTAISGGHIDGNDMANTCIDFSDKIRQNRINNVYIDRFTGIGLHVSTSGNRRSSDSLISNCRIGNVQTPQVRANTIGIKFDSLDNQVDNCYICDCQTCIWSEGWLMAANTHFFTTAIWYEANLPTYGIVCFGGMQGTNLYFDSVTYAISCKSSVILNTIYVYNFFNSENITRYYFRTQNGSLRLTNFVKGTNYPNEILFQLCDFSSDFKITERHESTYYDYYCDSEITPTSANDRATDIGGNKYTHSTLLNNNVVALNAYDGIRIGYMPLDKSPAFYGEIISQSTFDFTGTGIIRVLDKTKTPTNRSKLVDFHVESPNYGMAMGTVETLSIFGMEIEARPLYIYAKRNLPSSQRFVMRPMYLNGRVGWFYTHAAEIVPLTESNTVATLNNNGAL